MMLVGNQLDDELLALAQQPRTPQTIRKLHALRTWKAEFDRRIDAGIDALAADPHTQDAVAAAMDRTAEHLAQEDAAGPAPEEPPLVEPF
jgi:hypothetical protein